MTRRPTFFFGLRFYSCLRNIKESENVQGLTIFNNQFLYTTYTDDTTFFLSNENSVTEVTQIFEHFSFFSGLELNNSKEQITSTGALKGVQMTLCGMECVNVKKNTIKILEIYFS